MPPCPAGPESTWMESRYISCSAAIIAKRVFLPRKTTTATCTGWEQRAVNSECALHAYGLMTNPVHLLLTPKKAEAVPRLIISLGRRYVPYINRS